MFVAHYLAALVCVGLVLVALSAAARMVRRGRLAGSAARRIVSVIESTALTQTATLHVVKAGARFYLIGGAGAHVSTLAELPAEDVEARLR